MANNQQWTDEMIRNIAFTDRSFEVLRLARHLAAFNRRKRLRSDDLLWGLWMEGSGVAGTVLKALGLEFDVANCPKPPQESRTTMVRRGRTGLKLAARDLRIVIDAARVRAEHLYVKLEFERHTGSRKAFLGTEHMLLGIIDQPSSRGYELLAPRAQEREMTPNDVATTVLEILGAIEQQCQ
jgi:Clp amino terminal domain, pathogenicity island component